MSGEGSPSVGKILKKELDELDRKVKSNEPLTERDLLLLLFVYQQTTYTDDLEKMQNLLERMTKLMDAIVDYMASLRSIMSATKEDVDLKVELINREIQRLEEDISTLRERHVRVQGEVS
ncbi:hypothetical protein HS1genome_1530 [Sulfodiicoccus acidiphilus]|uniref:Uncharacterized protein n=1 Tax=Sulfodiicoccus acidiphilus TaxID=1670455 RepID=A0A348B4N9_9CREN|nr:hypothetical protein [Sulfodiicoccus acidiphilus]BBD73141.1 hypothetical protein HS1genome_1530 [Sulfodiicoccus acidiphilus]GGU00521.1 hypothetical protein GCM10007116_17190 [Sulfodiicoccus acidiphilus]